MKLEFKIHKAFKCDSKFYYSSNNISTWLLLWKIGFKYRKVAKIFEFNYIIYSR